MIIRSHHIRNTKVLNFKKMTQTFYNIKLIKKDTGLKTPWLIN